MAALSREFFVLYNYTCDSLYFRFSLVLKMEWDGGQMDRIKDKKSKVKSWFCWLFGHSVVEDIDTDGLVHWGRCSFCGTELVLDDDDWG